MASFVSLDNQFNARLHNLPDTPGGAVRYLLNAPQLAKQSVGVSGGQGEQVCRPICAPMSLHDLALPVAAAEYFERPQPPVNNYDLLLSGPGNFGRGEDCEAEDTISNRSRQEVLV